MAEPKSHFQGSWRTLAVASLILSLGLVGTLVTVGFLKGVDALSTIALTLAVIAFIAQLVIFAIQTTHSGEQLREARQLNSSTLSLLGEVRTRVDSTYQMVSSHNDVLLRFANVKAEAREPGEPQPVPTAAKSPTVEASWSPTEEGRSLVRRSQKLPPLDVLETIVDKLEALPDSAIFNLSLNFGSHLAGALLGQSGDMGYTRGDQPLVDAGLVEKFGPDDQARVRMTEEGLLASTIFAVRWPTDDVPEGMRKRIRDLREKTSPSALVNIAGFRDM